MPRKNRSIPHAPYTPPPNNDQKKKRFNSRDAALRAIKELEKYNLNVSLSVYQSLDDGGWYLTSKLKSED